MTKALARACRAWVDRVARDIRDARGPGDLKDARGVKLSSAKGTEMLASNAASEEIMAGAQPT